MALGLKATLKRFWRLQRQRVRGYRWSIAAGVVAATVLAVNVNLLAARHYQRWDWTSTERFTLSPATRQILASLSEPVEVIVFLSRADRLSIDVRHLLTAYQAETPELRVRFVDPDQNPAEFAALQQQHGVVAGRAPDGRVVADTSVMILKGDQSWFVTLDELVRVDDEGQLAPRLEQSITEGIARVLQHDEATLCFATGHGELSLGDMGPHGLVELRQRLERNNFSVEEIDLSLPGDRQRELSRCDALVIAGPEVPFNSGQASLVQRWHATGKALLLLINPLIDGDGNLIPSGLERVARAAGIELSNRYVIERNPERRLPQGLGEAFFADPRPHAATRALALSEEQVTHRVLMVASQSLGTTTDGSATPLLVSSKDSFSIQSLRGLERGGRAPEQTTGDPTGPFYLALAHDSSDHGKEPGPGRTVVVGSANAAWSRNFEDPALLGNRLFVEGAVAWLTERPALVSVPAEPPLPAGVSLTEASLAELWRYVILYMPGAAALCGLFMLARRRSKEADASEPRAASGPTSEAAAPSQPKKRRRRREREPRS